MLLDLSAAFAGHTVDHRILLDRLQFDFGISGSALNWIESYLSNRTQRIYIDGVLSSNFNLKFGVPQGSCLGPLLFSLYASKLFKIVESHLPNPHCYADSLRASSPIWASEVSLARMREQGAEERRACNDFS